jgi:hypothetical protein
VVVIVGGASVAWPDAEGRGTGYDVPPDPRN